MLMLLLAEATPSDFERIAEKFGIPVVIALALAYVLYKVLWHLATQHTESLKKRDEAFDKQAVSFERQSESMDKQSRALEEQSKAIVSISHAITTVCKAECDASWRPEK